jgi:small-conductance mechanosensitive channel
LPESLGLTRAACDAVRAGAPAHSGASGSATIFVNITWVLVLALGALIVLNSVGVSITPLLTALGVGGLAVALALQDTLTNLFAGVHILASRKVQAGDFIQLDSGQQGYVVDTNWRNTTIRELLNLVIVPNAMLATSIITNFHQPEHESSIVVQVGVAYDSDLDLVEGVTCEVGKEVMRPVDGYRQEGTEIPFPVRTIVAAPGDRPGGLFADPFAARDRRGLAE